MPCIGHWPTVVPEFEERGMLLPRWPVQLTAIVAVARVCVSQTLIAGPLRFMLGVGTNKPGLAKEESRDRTTDSADQV
jgi:hypothetical protein